MELIVKRFFTFFLGFIFVVTLFGRNVMGDSVCKTVHPKACLQDHSRCINGIMCVSLLRKCVICECDVGWSGQSCDYEEMQDNTLIGNSEVVETSFINEKRTCDIPERFIPTGACMENILQCFFDGLSFGALKCKEKWMNPSLGCCAVKDNHVAPFPSIVDMEQKSKFQVSGRKCKQYIPPLFSHLFCYDNIEECSVEISSSDSVESFSVKKCKSSYGNTSSGCCTKCRQKCHDARCIAMGDSEVGLCVCRPNFYFKLGSGCMPHLETFLPPF